MSTTQIQFAYKVGYMSKYRIEREARKAEPRLHKLVGHASLFDSAKKYIVEHIDDDDEDDKDHQDELLQDDVLLADEWPEDEDDVDDEELASIDEVDELFPLEDIEETLESLSPCSQTAPLPQYHHQHQYQYHQASTNRLGRPAQRPQQMVPATSGSYNTNTIQIEEYEIDHDDVDDWDSISDASTEAADNELDPDTDTDSASDSDSDWSESTYGNDESLAVYEAESDRKIIDLCALATSQFSMPKYCPQDDDLVLWAQQPKVMSQTQVDNLLTEIFA
ncbi:hypothetical protein A1O1_05211 [Capronia coronata CBS 617.96]|uniref:Uncharacterized protein n=1 Tax=Capronia coronata CBS 617.96 TaxID=1182541 RepID=W9YG88_9EURO|nr:uncharacterized protein A1O1_05211 [Capronia coronata CBS 617.96]EXJ88281.1 hypothetical protein A1O1_05211 [Capronia coronata CBS 617.96]